MSRKLLLTAFVLGLALMASAAFANPPAMSDIHDEKALLAQGWQRITDGVLQRKLGGNKVETFAFGSEGAEWMLQRLEDRLGFLLGEYEKYPSDRLRKVILDLQRDIREMKSSLETSSSISSMTSAATFGAEALTGCDVSFGAHADAYPLYPGPGVGATANAYFYNNCFYWGVASANVYVRTTQGGVTTGDSAAQTQEGENVSAYAALTRNGLEDCYSNAWAMARSDGLGILYETSDFNDDCPPPPLTIDITGPTFVTIYGYNYRTLIWNATVSGGVPPYGAINWYRDGYWVGSGSAYSATFYGENWNWTEYVNLTATVSDSVSAFSSDSHTTTVRYYPSKICPINEESSEDSSGEAVQQIICPY
jgi:hypothetical protein